jgi:hypothetical protein
LSNCGVVDGVVDGVVVVVVYKLYFIKLVGGYCKSAGGVNKNGTEVNGSVYCYGITA